VGDGERDEGEEGGDQSETHDGEGKVEDGEQQNITNLFIRMRRASGGLWAVFTGRCGKK
jgi:hypothetical protein